MSNNVSVENLIDMLSGNKTASANNLFADLMSSKINDVLDDKRAELAASYSNGGSIDTGEAEAYVDVQAVSDDDSE
jgi:hypothetical protein